jgi:threonine/homoserine/homoserine lactone efflux protein
VDHELLAFLAIATLLTITPGPDMALVTRNVLRGGLRAGLATSGAILSGLVAWACLSAIGVAALLAASATAFAMLELAGAAYLVSLGVVTLWRTRKSRMVEITGERGVPAVAARGQYRQGLLSNLLNPKVGIFYTTFLPQFVGPGQSVLARTSLLAGVHLAISIAWLGFYAWLVQRIKEAVRRPGARRALDRVTGTVLVGLGIRVAGQTVR